MGKPERAGEIKLNADGATLKGVLSALLHLPPGTVKRTKRKSAAKRRKRAK